MSCMLMATNNLTPLNSFRLTSMSVDITNANPICNAPALKIVKALLRLELALKLWRTNVHKTFAQVHGTEITILYELQLRRRHP